MSGKHLFLSKMIKHAESANDVSRIVEIRKIAEVVAEVEKHKQTKINSSSSGDSLDTASGSSETSTVVRANCTCFCTIKDAIFKLFKCR